MNTPLPPTVWVCLASDAARQALRAVCMAMRQPPADLVAGPGALARLWPTEQAWALELCHAMASHVKAIDRMYHFKTYPSCHTGTEAVDWLSTRFQLKRPAAVRLGLDLQTLGLLQHVVHEQPFAAEILLNRLLRFGLIEHVTGDHPVRDGNFFYRFTARQPAAASRAGYAPMAGVRLAGRLQENT